MSIVIRLTYLLAAVLFIFGLKRMSHPRTAVTGNRLGALGMLLAVVATLADREIGGFILIGIGRGDWYPDRWRSWPNGSK